MTFMLFNANLMMSYESGHDHVLELVPYDYEFRSEATKIRIATLSIKFQCEIHSIKKTIHAFAIMDNKQSSSNYL